MPRRVPSAAIATTVDDDLAAPSDRRFRRCGVDARELDDSRECYRCGAIVAKVGRHEQWRQQLEGTNKSLPPDPHEPQGFTSL